jgi:predicted MFS family arabinose efflux permease
MKKKINNYLLKCSFIGTFAEYLLVPIYAIYVERVGGSLLDIGIAFSIFNIVKGLFVILMGKTDFYKKNLHTFIMYGFALSALCDCSYMFISNYIQFFFVQAIAGIALALINPAWEALYSDVEDTDEASEKWTFWNGGVDFIIGIAAIVGGLMIRFVGWNCLFTTMGLISLSSIYFAYKVFKIKNL